MILYNEEVRDLERVYVAWCMVFIRCLGQGLRWAGRVGRMDNI
jgi:hypothetical protein